MRSRGCARASCGRQGVAHRRLAATSDPRNCRAFLRLKTTSFPQNRYGRPRTSRLQRRARAGDLRPAQVSGEARCSLLVDSMKAESIASPLDDLTFDLVSVLHKKAQALEAYAKYLQRAEEDD